MTTMGTTKKKHKEKMEGGWEGTILTKNKNKNLRERRKGGVDFNIYDAL